MATGYRILKAHDETPVQNARLEVELPTGETVTYMQTNAPNNPGWMSTDYNDIEARQNDGGGWAIFGCNNRNNPEIRNYLCLSISVGVVILSLLALTILVFMIVGNSTTNFHAAARSTAFAINGLNADLRLLILQGRLIAMEQTTLLTQQLHCAMHLQCTRQNAALGTHIDCDYTDTTMAIQCPIPPYPYGPLDVLPGLNYTISADDVRSVLWKASTSSNDFTRELASLEKHGMKDQYRSFYQDGFYSSAAASSQNTP